MIFGNKEQSVNTRGKGERITEGSPLCYDRELYVVTSGTGDDDATSTTLLLQFESVDFEVDNSFAAQLIKSSMTLIMALYLI